MLFLEQTTIESLRGQLNAQKRFPQLNDDDVVERRPRTTRRFRVVANEKERDFVSLEAMLIPPVNAVKEHEHRPVRIGIVGNDR